ncbi:MAG: HAD family hydrolase [Thermoprotei archaeon]|nr:MAG: HAD family hydrolase [Thermoprotei archaeon]RLE56775.1 MAG: HAD family hydrolase [Thermoprotei archaeon]
MVLKAIVFDVDGTLVDSVDAVVESFRLAAKELGVGIDLDAVKRLLGLPSREIARLVGVPSNLLDRFVELRRQYMGMLWSRYVKLYPDVIEVLSELRRRGFKLGVASGNIRSRLEFMLNYFGIAQYFDAVVAQDEVQRPKPYPDIIVEALRRLGVEPEESIYVGDTVIDVVCARSANVKIVIVKRPHVTDDLGADYVIRDLRELLNLVDELARSR